MDGIDQCANNLYMLQYGTSNYHQLSSINYKTYCYDLFCNYEFSKLGASNMKCFSNSYFSLYLYFSFCIYVFSNFQSITSSSLLANIAGTHKDSILTLESPLQRVTIQKSCHKKTSGYSSFAQHTGRQVIKDFDAKYATYLVLSMLLINFLICHCFCKPRYFFV